MQIARPQMSENLHKIHIRQGQLYQVRMVFHKI
jgi:hypothetical protein